MAENITSSFENIRFVLMCDSWIYSWI